MASVEDICNIALDHLGQQRISDFDNDTTQEAVRCRGAYEQVRDSLLRSHYWNCAIKRTVLGENLLTFSEAFDNAAWTKTNASVTADQIIAPFGGTLADELDDSDGANAGVVEQSVTVPNNDDQHTASIYLKQGTAAVTRITLAYSGGTPVSEDVDVTWGATPSISGGSIEEVENGWWRIKIVKANNDSGNTTLKLTINPAGATAADTGTVYAWGAQISATSAAIQYAKTESANSPRIRPRSVFKYSFPLPDDYQRVYDVNDGDLDYKIESGNLLTNDAAVDLRYVYDVTDATQFDDQLVEAIGYKLAIRLCKVFNASDTLRDRLEKAFRMAVAHARTTDAQEDGTDSEPIDPWIGYRNWEGSWTP